MKNALILLAGGSGSRVKTKIPKQFLKFGSSNIIEYFLFNLYPDIFDIIVISTQAHYKEKYLKFIKKKYKQHNLIFSNAGNTRQLSSKNSLMVLKKYNPKKVLIHDSARPLTSNELINKILKCLNKNISSIPYVIHNDMIKYKKNINIKNDQIMNIQTPQGFDFNTIYKAHMINKNIDSKDDSTILENYGIKLKMIKGDIKNIKITNKDDIDFFNSVKNKEYRSGIGYDIHRINFKSKKKLTLCGVKINHPPLIGHSDADVGYHAVCDSILGSLSLNDIGYYFNDNDDRWKNANSKKFINFCYNKLVDNNFKITNLDINFICETPNINKLSILMKKNLSRLLKISKNQIAIKATTNEKIALIGKGEGIAAESIVQIENV